MYKLKQSQLFDIIILHLRLKLILNQGKYFYGMKFSFKGIRIRFIIISFDFKEMDKTNFNWKWIRSEFNIIFSDSTEIPGQEYYAQELWREPWRDAPATRDGSSTPRCPATGIFPVTCCRWDTRCSTIHRCLATGIFPVTYVATGKIHEVHLLADTRILGYSR